MSHWIAMPIRRLFTPWKWKKLPLEIRYLEDDGPVVLMLPKSLWKRSRKNHECH